MKTQTAATGFQRGSGRVHEFAARATSAAAVTQITLLNRQGNCALRSSGSTCQMGLATGNIMQNEKRAALIENRQACLLPDTDFRATRNAPKPIAIPR